MMLDIYELCTSDLQAKLNPTRECFRIQDEDVKTKKASAKQAADGDEAANGKKVEEPEKTYASYSFDDDIGSNNSGYYELIGVLTHKGRSANSGHYVGWTKNQKTNEWFMFDDDQVSKVSEEEILKLSGGGDWHTAYVLFYGPRRLEAKYLKSA
jgi:ubiquitin carboxyl-terminal hydrolase 14